LLWRQINPEVNYSITRIDGWRGCFQGKHRAAAKMDENRDLEVRIFSKAVSLKAAARELVR
jgi:hypothetical protein